MEDKLKPVILTKKVGEKTYYFLVDDTTKKILWDEKSYDEKLAEARKEKKAEKKRRYGKSREEYAAERKPTKGISVDASISINPGGSFEYRGVDLATGKEIFRFNRDPKILGTNNIAEYLAITHAIGYIDAKDLGYTKIYSDSMTAISWVNRKRTNSSFKHKETDQIVIDATEYIQEAGVEYKVLHWKKKLWGEPPSDYGRK